MMRKSRNLLAVKKGLLFLLSIAMLLPVLVSCREDKVEPSESESTQGTETSNTVQEPIPGGSKLLKEEYVFNTAEVGGGGFVTGLVFHADGTGYARTDVGGLFRLDVGSTRWVSVTDTLPGGPDATCVDGVAVAPSNSKIVYMATGRDRSKNGYLWKSADGGVTWKETSLKTKFYANNGYPVENGFGVDSLAGECVAIHPTNPDIVYVGSRGKGVFRTVDGGESWETVTAIPEGRNNIGNRCILFDKNNPQKIYVSALDEGIYTTNDGGATWSLMVGSPTQTKRMDVLSNGNLIAVAGKTCFYDHTHADENDGIYLFDGTQWSEISPPAKNQKNGAPPVFGDVAVHPEDENYLAAFCLTDRNMYVSENGGQTWSAIKYIGITRKDGIDTWISDWGLQQNITCMEFDPKNPDQLLCCWGGGIWRCDDIKAETVTWRIGHWGIEETVVEDVVASPLEDIAALAGVYDIDGFTIYDVTKPVPALFKHTGSADFGETRTIDYCWSEPNFVVRYGCSGDKKNGEMAYSEDGGRTWRKTAEDLEFTNKGYGYLAVSSGAVKYGNPSIVFVQKDSVPMVSFDMGETWEEVKGLPDTLITQGGRRYGNIVEADRSDPNVFYVLNPYNGDLYKSTDAGRNFSKIKSFYFTLFSDALDTACIETWADHPGYLVISFNGNGMYYSTDSGNTFRRFEGVSKANQMCVGKGPEGKKTPSLYIYGTVYGESGFFRSDDLGETWIKINEGYPLSYGVLSMDADPNIHGLLYIGTAGHGVMYGMPKNK